eukprot:8812054-Heterocapsa_arctica.AAC.1
MESDSKCGQLVRLSVPLHVFLRNYSRLDMLFVFVQWDPLDTEVPRGPSLHGIDRSSAQVRVLSVGDQTSVRQGHH